MTPIRIRKVDGKSEVNAALLLWLQLQILPYDTPADTSQGHWWVAFRGDQPAAFCGMYTSQRDPAIGYLCRAGVLPEFRGMRLQRRLIAVRERAAKKLGFTSLNTDTTPGNPASSNNLIACGFRMFSPSLEWAEGSCYWQKPLKT